MKTPAFYTSLLLICTNLCMADKIVDQKALRSPGGYTATYEAAKQEGTGSTIVKNKDGKEIARIANASPMSFSPVSDILLLKEAAADDDTRQYLLNIGAGEYQKKGKRTDYVFGSRYVISARWSKDGKKITLVNAPDLTANAEDVFAVADLLKDK